MGAQGDVPLVGREQELTVLRAALARAAGGHPGAVLVAGEAGVGKSRLVRALLDDAPRAREGPGDTSKARVAGVRRIPGADRPESGLRFRPWTC